MYRKVTLGFSISLIFVCCQCQYQQQPQQQQVAAEHYPRPPPPAILTHKQALNHDGNFKYLFTSENGLAQGESIAPDGTRHGGYSYTDPSGKKISVKYTAGKEGFKIVEANHLPKAPQPEYPLPQSAPHRPQGDYDDGQYRPQAYGNSRQQPQQVYSKPVYSQPAAAYNQPAAAYNQPAQYVQSKPQYAQLRANPAPITNQLDEREPEYNDEPGKPYSFGNGYLFEFSG